MFIVKFIYQRKWVKLSIIIEKRHQRHLWSICQNIKRMANFWAFSNCFATNSTAKKFLKIIQLLKYYRVDGGALNKSSVKLGIPKSFGFAFNDLELELLFENILDRFNFFFIGGFFHKLSRVLWVVSGTYTSSSKIARRVHNVSFGEFLSVF